MHIKTKLWIWLLIIALIVPLGLIATAPAWGEWDTAQLMEKLGYIPEGLKKIDRLWNGIISGYVPESFENSPLSAIGYIFSALTGIAITAGIALIIGRILSGKREVNELQNETGMGINGEEK
ncbi:MAG: PDGLE domain-containing protein [Fidelibacterota bacterium]